MLPGVGIFGTGPLAKTIIVYLKECGFKIAAVWSRTLQDAENFAHELNIPAYTNKVDDLLLKAEVGFVVIICTPHLQSPIAVKALGIGKHVVASWPAGTSQLEVLKMVKAATYYPSLLSMMCHGLRFLPSYTSMKKLIDSGYIGELFLFEVKVHGGIKLSEFSWQCDEMMGGGALSMHGSYVIDVISYLSGKKVKSVSGMMKTYVKNNDDIYGVRQITCDDFCSFQMELDDGVSVSCVINNLCYGESYHEIVAVGSAGRLIVQDLDLYGQKNEEQDLTELHVEPKESDETKLSSNCTWRIPFYQGITTFSSLFIKSINCRKSVMSFVVLGLLNALKGIAEAFQGVEDVHGWDSNVISGRATFDDALHVQTVIDSIRKSSHVKEWVNIKILDEEPDPNPHLSSVVRRSAYSTF